MVPKGALAGVEVGIGVGVCLSFLAAKLKYINRL